ncbi:lipoate--protein ligase family protein [Arthrobacter antibioticus]|uniref:lipoate--protein ligase family protein n=1 Tax=Arthrobacter sp. H35-MC1 TaxID=3046203 RepID=UPI0024B8EDE9|nr:lipoate--protein ligase family protein [Arthrobacter sp. H35-MC1]MDJ0315961.1 lipoate--protein ligase family protein [Arthrobacter sp. H35-MC1]
MNRIVAPRLEVRKQLINLGAEADLHHALDLLGQVKTGLQGDMLRFYRPEPTVAFGQRDTRLAGFSAAEQASRDNGFMPAVRRAGGRAAAYHQGTLIVDHIQHENDSIAGAKGRFGFFGDLFTQALRSLGVDAGVGEIPGEYCPGEFSVFGRSASSNVKLVGTAQRVVAGAWLFSSVIVVENSAPIRKVLVDSYAALELQWDPATAGAVEDLRPGLSVEDVEAAILAVYAKHTELFES